MRRVHTLPTPVVDKEDTFGEQKPVDQMEEEGISEDEEVEMPPPVVEPLVW